MGTVVAKLKMVPLSEMETMSCNAGKGKVHRVTGHDDPVGEWKYSTTLSLTLATLSEPRSGCFTPGKRELLTFVQEARWASGPV